VEAKDLWGTAIEGIKYVGSLGGLVYIVNLFVLFVNRVRVVVRDVQDCSRDTLKVSFEAENLGRSPTSIQKFVTLRCYLPRPVGEKRNWKPRLHKYEFALKLEGSERSLPPSSPKEFEAEKKLSNANILASIGFTFFRTYTFSFTHGRKRRVRIRSASGVQIGVLRYYMDLTLFSRLLKNSVG
jgi:hypothetical protein